MYMMLYNPYKERYFYWEPIRLLEQLPYIILVTIAWDMGRLTRALLLLLVALASNVLLSLVRPFRYPVLVRVEMVAGMVTLAVLVLLTIIEHGEVDEGAALGITIIVGIILAADTIMYMWLILKRAKQDYDRLK